MDSLGSALGALGIVYGDIGTSVLYAFRECLAHTGRDQEEILGILSLIIWTLTLLVPRSPGLRNPATARIYKGGVVQRDRSYYPRKGLAVADRRVCQSLVARDRFLPPLLRTLKEAESGHVSETADGACGTLLAAVRSRLGRSTNFFVSNTRFSPRCRNKKPEQGFRSAFIRPANESCAVLSLMAIV